MAINVYNIQNITHFNDKSNIFKQQHPNSEEYISSLLPHTLYDGGVAVHEPSHIEYIGSGRLFNKWEQWRLAFKLSSEENVWIVNKQVKFLTTQCIGTCKSVYTKGYALNWVQTNEVNGKHHALHSLCKK